LALRVVRVVSTAAELHFQRDAVAATPCLGHGSTLIFVQFFEYGGGEFEPFHRRIKDPRHCPTSPQTRYVLDFANLSFVRKDKFLRTLRLKYATVPIDNIDNKRYSTKFFHELGKEKKITCTNLESLVLRQTYSRRKVEWSLAPEELRASVFVKDVWFMLEAEGCPRSLTQIAR
jgi:hypothetical protein